MEFVIDNNRYPVTITLEPAQQVLEWLELLGLEGFDVQREAHGCVLEKALEPGGGAGKEAPIEYRC